MKPGDVLVYWGIVPGSTDRKPSHLAMAFDAGFILHNTINPRLKFAGVVKHAAVQAATGYLNLEGAKIEVFRLTEESPIATYAADYGGKWTAPEIITVAKDFTKAGTRTLVDPQQFPTNKNDRQPLTKAMNPWIAGKEDVSFDEFKTGKSPYSTGRLATGQNSPQQSWSQLSAFRAVKACVRASLDQGLSPRHGTSCDQFVMYCYQAASVKMMLGGGDLNASIIELIAANPKQIKLYLSSSHEPTQDLGVEVSQRTGPAWEKLQDLLKEMTGSKGKSGFLPQAMASDAKTSSVEKLYVTLTSDNSGFRRIGQLNKSALIVD
jgi:hypothetical protein